MNTGWCLSLTPLKNLNVNWDDDIHNIWNNKNVPKHQPDEQVMQSYSGDVHVKIQD